MRKTENIINYKSGILDALSEIKIEDASEIVYKQINDLIINGNLKPGMRIPSERELSELLGVGRSQIREALRKLEFYGLIETVPQSGSVIKEFNLDILKNLSAIIIFLIKKNHKDVLNFWKILQLGSIDYITIPISESEIKKMRIVNNKLMNNLSDIDSSISLDVSFHLYISDFSNNILMESISNDITHHIFNFMRNDINRKWNIKSAEEHEQIINYLQENKLDKAREFLQYHLNNFK